MSATNAAPAQAPATSACSQVELEIKLAPDSDAAVPKFGSDQASSSGSDGAAGDLGTLCMLGEPQVQELSAVYFDTKDLRLSRAKITLRRRTGGNDAGWHVKLPAQLGRTEIHHPLQEDLTSDEVLAAANDGASLVPDVVRAHVRAIVRDLPLVPIARVDNERHEYLLGLTAVRPDSGRKPEPLAEFCDDHVTAYSYLEGGTSLAGGTRLEGGTRQFWREWEVEATHTALEHNIANEVLQQARETLLAAGARESDSPSKLVAALGDSIHNAPTPPRTATTENPAHAAVLSTLKRNADVLVAMDIKVRRDEFDSVHQMRVATRELRSHLKAFRALFAPGSTTALDEALKQLAAILGKARDAEVIHQQLEDAFAQPLREATDDAMRQQIPALAMQDYRRAHTRVVRALDDPRYLHLLAMLEEFLSNPPLAGSGPACELDGELDGEPSNEPSDLAAEDPCSEAAEAPSGDVAEEITSTQRTEGKKAPRSAQPATLVLLADLHRTWDNVLRKQQALVPAPRITGMDHKAEETYHDLRKAIKKLRYVTEAVGEAAGAEGFSGKLPLGKLYRACKQAQSSLGDVQDAVTARDWVLRQAHKTQRRGEDTFALGACFQYFQQQTQDAIHACLTDVHEVEKAQGKLAKKGAKLEAKLAQEALAKKAQKAKEKQRGGKENKPHKKKDKKKARGKKK